VRHVFSDDITYRSVQENRYFASIYLSLKCCNKSRIYHPKAQLQLCIVANMTLLPRYTFDCPDVRGFSNYYMQSTMQMAKAKYQRAIPTVELTIANSSESHWNSCPPIKDLANIYSGAECRCFDESISPVWRPDNVSVILHRFQRFQINTVP
jgi:hypothetical protein